MMVVRNHANVVEFSLEAFKRKNPLMLQGK
jgi:hypothetical protein